MKTSLSKIALVIVLTYVSVNSVLAQTTNVFPLSGNAGIGTTSPTTKLHIATTPAVMNDGIYLQHNGVAWIKMCSPSLTSGAYNTITQPGDAGIIFGASTGINTVTNGYVIAPHTSGTAMGLRIDKNGNVGIGTSLVNNPNSYRLAVNGTIGAKAIQVEVISNTWADYVFAKDYKLMSLKDVAIFIQKNKHLPDVPTTVEVEKNGINVAEMNALLLKKVEELTLYMLEMQKEIDALKTTGN